MKINVLLSPHNADELYFSGKNTIVIDVLRASTVIVTALKNNAKEVIPVDSVDFALKVSVRKRLALVVFSSARKKLYPLYIKAGM